MPKVLGALAIVFYVAVVELSDHFSVAEICSTKDCSQTVDDYSKLMNVEEDPCQNFFEYACGNSKSFLNSQGFNSHMEFLRKQVEGVSTANSSRLDTPISAEDSDIIKAAKQRLQLCTSTSANQKVQQVVNFLNHLATFRTWWELENYTVKKGFESSLFFMQRYFTSDLIEKFGLFPRLWEDNMELFKNDVRSAMPLLQDSGLSLSARKLLNKCPGNKWVSTSDMEPDEMSDEVEDGVNALPDEWIADQYTTSEQSREDWYKYFNNWWSDQSNNVDWVNKYPVVLKVPAAMSKKGSKWLDKAKSIKTGVVCYTLWQLLQNMNLSGDDPSACNKIIDAEKIANLDMERNYFPDSLKKSVQALSATVELQTKLQLYKKLPKYTNENHFMGTPKLDLYNHLVIDAKAAVMKLTQEIKEKKCCGNCGMDQVVKTARRVVRFEKRYPRDQKAVYNSPPSQDPVVKEQFFKLLRYTPPLGTVIGLERNKAVPAKYFNVSDSPATLLRVVLEKLRVARTYTFDWLGRPEGIIEALTLANKPGVKFRKDRPAALNYGGLGAIIAANFPQPTTADPLHFEDVQWALDIAWGAYLYDKRRGYQDPGRLSSLPNSDDDKLFFLAFANNLCDAQQDRNTINNILKKHEGFKAAYCTTEAKSRKRQPYTRTPRPLKAED